MAANIARVILSGLLIAYFAAAGDWTTFAHDPARTGWASDEQTITLQNASSLRLEWKTHVNNQSFSLSALTVPVAAAGISTANGPRTIVYVAGIGGTVFAIDARSGELVWTKSLRSMANARKGGLQGTYLCPNGITATPVIDKDTHNLYVTAPDGSLYGLDLGDGKVKYGPVPFVAPFSKSWSLNLVDGIVYTTVSLGCGNGRAGVYSVDIRDPRRPATHESMLSGAYTAGIWGRGGAVIGGGSIYGGTADGDTNPSAGDYSNTVIAMSLAGFAVTDYFLPRNWAYLKKNDLDVGSSSPVWFTWHGRRLLAHGFKEGVVYLLDADHPGGSDHSTPLFVTPRLGNDAEECCAASGIWGSLSIYRDGAGQDWLYVPMGGPPSAQAPRFPVTNGPAPHGSIMAFKVVSAPPANGPVLEPAWISGDFWYPDPPAIANGVLFALSNGENPDQHGDESKRLLNTRPAVLRALDARTGRVLFTSGEAIETWAHFSGLAIADGRIVAVDHNSNVYCFGTSEGNRVSTAASQKVERPGDALSSSWIGRAEDQDEILKVWIRRAAVTAGLALLAALAGIWAAIRAEGGTGEES
jgi:outer membrane protein assembly factor BamB